MQFAFLDKKYNFKYLPTSMSVQYVSNVLVGSVLVLSADRPVGRKDMKIRCKVSSRRQRTDKIVELLKKMHRRLYQNTIAVRIRHNCDEYVGL